GQPARPIGASLPDVRRAGGLLRAVGQPGRRARVARVWRAQHRAAADVRQGVYRAAAGRALAGRRRGPRRGPDLPAGRGPAPLRGPRVRSRRRQADAGGQAADGLPGDARERVARRGRAADPHAPGTAGVRRGRVRGGGTLRAARDRALGVRRARPATSRERGPTGCVAGANAGAPRRIAMTETLQNGSAVLAAYESCEALTRSAAA